MKTSRFQIIPIQTEIADAARRVVSEGAADHALVIVDSPGSNPCRHCLRWAQPGERVILFPYSAIPSGHPYSETGPIFVHANECQRYSATNQYPADFRNGRVFRAYDSNYNIVDAQLMNGSEPEAVIERFFQNPDTALWMCAALPTAALRFEFNALDVECMFMKFGARISSMHQRL